MSDKHSHAVPANKNEATLWVALALTSTFLVAEVVAGVMLASLALLADAAHMFTDAAALGVALAAVRFGRRPADGRRTYGYYRFEILAAAFNAMLLFAVALYILYEAWQRFNHPAEVQTTGMLIVAVLGLLINLVSMRLLSSGKDESLNLKGAYLEVWSDMLGSLGVIAAAVLIRYTGWVWVDTVVAIGIGLWVLPRTWILLRDALNILLEGVPEGVDLVKIEQAVRTCGGVTDLHDLHIWSLSSGKHTLTSHIVYDRNRVDADNLLVTLHVLLSRDFGIHHVTLQLESKSCEEAEAAHTYQPAVRQTS
ncbi:MULTISPECIES: cation diffusion facilitator family transporter [Roseateles]|uniref:Cation diffusion facilitator family transporter n=1 Tax=Roseateles flavus TaxID=3149041 RepID=A0ABV0GFL2_9BURK